MSNADGQPAGDVNDTDLAPAHLAIDADSDPHDSGVLVVTNVTDTRADAHTIDAIEQSVADVNPAYPDADPVVEAAYVPELDTVIGPDRWRAWAVDDDADWLTHLGEHCRVWSLHVKRYSFPASRLFDFGDVAQAHDVHTDALTQGAGVALAWLADEHRGVLTDALGDDEPPTDASRALTVDGDVQRTVTAEPDSDAHSGSSEDDA